jgi:acyl-CoA synthetase (AMP-forming)/AMP-acid ligase II/NAD(P)-dependent dehydrogenase (short-subunit alcohol dehydrogenase family)
MTSKQIYIHQVFEAQAERTPKVIAVNFQGSETSYEELNRRANQLAHYLSSCGVDSNATVGLYLEYSLELVVGVLGILKAGGTFVLLDPSNPQRWQEDILQDTHVQVLLTREKWQNCLSFNGKIVCLDREAQAIARKGQENKASAGANNIASFFHTSGHSLILEQKQLYNQSKWLQRRFALSATDVLLSLSSPSEDSILFDMFSTLTIGACLLIATQEELENCEQRQQLFARNQVSIIHASIPSLRLLTEASPLETLRLVLASGELPSNTFIKTFMSTFNGTFSYLFGGLESAYYLELNAAEQSDDAVNMVVRQATPMAVYILNARKQLVPPGGSGEIFVVGSGVASGYLDDPVETENRFLADSFTNARMFRTGLRGRYRSGGKIEIQDTDTRRVWIGGSSILLDEVEQVLLQQTTIYNCRVIARRNQSDEQELVAYVVTNDQHTPEIWQEQLQAMLPAVYRPHAYIPISHLPLTKNGEIDDQALLTIAPLTAQTLAQWEQYLRGQEGIEKVAVVAQEHFAPQMPLHLADLLPDWGKYAQTQEELQDITERQAHPPISQHTQLSICEGGALRLDQHITTLPQALLRATRQNPESRLISILPDGSELVWTYQQLLTEAQRVLSGLRRLGVQPQERVILQVEWCQEFLPVLWGCLLGGIVPVPVSIAPTYEQPSSTSNRLHHAWQMLGQPIVVGGSNLASSLQALALHEGWNEFRVMPFSTLQASDALDEHYHESQAEDLALILLTSGSTGAAKGVTLSHRNLLSMVQGMIQRFEFATQKDITFNWMPLDHVGGIVMLHLRALYLANTQIHALPQTILHDPLRWLDYLDHYRATITWAPNFAFGLVNERLEEIQQRHWDLSSLHYVFNGGEAIVGKVARRFLELLQPYKLPPTAIHPAWGMSETSSGVIFSRTFSSKNDETSPLVEIGEPIPGLSVRLVDENNLVVMEEQPGRLQVRGLSVTSGYYQNMQATQEAFTADGWFDTGDLGVMRAGQLTITGRAKDVIIINGINYYSQEIEAAVEELEEVETSYTAAVAVRDGQSTTDQLAIFLVSRGQEAQILDVLRKVRARISAQIGIAPSYVLPVTKEAIPKTAIGKIQRTQLKKEFEAGQYRSLLHDLDRLQGNANTLPDWFYRKIWQPRLLRQYKPHNLEGTILVLLDEEGVGAVVCEHLRQQQQRCICVEPGTGFERLAKDHYRISPDDEAEYRLLSTAMAAEEITIKHVIHLWGYHPRRAENAEGNHLKDEHSRGLLSVLYLVRALEPVWKPEEVENKQSKLVVVSNQVEAVRKDEEIAYEKAPIIGLLKTFERELSWLQCIHIDVQADNIRQNAHHILYDLAQNQEDQEVAYRDGQRFVARLEHIDWSKEPSRPLPLQQKSFYLISGGLGGVGYELACHLLREYQARLLLIGRTPIDSDHGAEVASSRRERQVVRLTALQELAQHGGEVHYEAVDVCDLDGVRQAVNKAQQRWQRPLDGVFHLAGTFHEQELLRETAQQIEQVLQPKVVGTWTLHQLLKDRPNTLFVNFSSVNAIFGGSGVGAYASANSFLESFTHYQRVHCSLQSYCLAWSMWDEIGMSQGYQLKGLSQASGYQPITPQQGWYSLLAALHRSPDSLLVGLDGCNQQIRRHLVGPGYALLDAVAYLSAQLERSTQSGWPSEWGTLPDNYYLVQLETLPLKETGEIDVERLKNASHARGQTSTQEPRTEIERQLAEIWRQVLKNPQIGVYDNFFELGGHSLLATQVITRIQHIFHTSFLVRTIFEHPTIADLAQLLEQHQQQSYTPPPLVPVTRDQSLPLSFAQQRLWFLDQLEPDSTTYAVPLTVVMEGPLALTAFVAALNGLIARHEVLRTTFQQQDGDPYQLIAPQAQIDLIFVDLLALPSAQRESVAQQGCKQELHRPFDLKRGPLLRCCLWRVSEQTHWLRLNMHHIISDGWSMNIFVEELTRLYHASLSGEQASLPALPIQYADYAHWQRSWLQGTILKEHLRYWTSQLSQAQALELPTDFPRSPTLSQRGARHARQLPPDLARLLQTLSHREGVTLFMTLLAAFQILLARSSGQTDVVVGTDSANRSHLETERLIGFFVNLLALRSSLHDHPSFLQVLERVRDMVLGAYAHQELPFEMLVEHLRLPRAGHRTPLINVLFVMQNVPLADADLSDIQVHETHQEQIHAKFDLALFVSENSNGLHCSAVYSTDLFKETTIAKLLHSYEILLHDIITHPDTPIDGLEMRSEKEKEEGEKTRQQSILARKSKLKRIDRAGIELD